MPISDETAKILEGDIWASAAGALKQDPGDATPAVTRANGWTAPYSATIVPEQETFQGRFNELDSAVVDIFTAGVPFYDARIDYPTGAVTNEAGTLSRALRENGPNQANAAVAPSADTAGTTWATISGVQTVPGAPGQPTATSPAFGTLDWAWNCPLDGGSIITAFRAQWRRSGQNWPGTEVTINMPAHPFLTLTGLAVGVYELRVKAQTALGESANWSPVGSATVAATLPGGGNTLALHPTREGDSEVDLAWIEPNLNGGTLIRYEAQWRTGSQSFSSTRQSTFTGTTGTITGLTNGTEYFFRVRVVTNAGSGAWSNVASATPEAADPVWNLAGQTTLPADTRTLVDLNRSLSLLTDIAPVYDRDADSLDYSRYWQAAKPFAGQQTSSVYALVEQGNSVSVHLHTVNLGTGALTAVGSAVAITGVAGVGLVESGGTVYAGVLSSNGFRLHTVNLGTGALTAVGSAVAITGVRGVGLVESGGTVYAGVLSSNVFRLHTVNLTTGTLTAVGSAVAVTGVRGVGLVESGGTVYAGVQVTNGFRLHTVNLTTGTLTAVGSAVAVTGVGGVGLVESGGTVYAGMQVSNGFRLHTVNLTTGALTVVGSAVAGFFGSGFAGIGLAEAALAGFQRDVLTVEYVSNTCVAITASEAVTMQELLGYD